MGNLAAALQITSRDLRIDWTGLWVGALRRCMDALPHCSRLELLDRIQGLWGASPGCGCVSGCRRAAMLAGFETQRRVASVRRPASDVDTVQLACSAG